MQLGRGLLRATVAQASKVTAAATADELATVVLPRVRATVALRRWAAQRPDLARARRNSATAAVHLASRRHRRLRVALAVLRERSFAAAAVDAAGAYAAARCITRRRVVGTQRAMMQWRREAAFARAVAVVSSHTDVRSLRRAFLRLRSAVYAAAELRFISALGAQAAAQRAVRGAFTRWACTAWAERRLPRLQRSRWLLRHTLHAWWGAALRELKRGSALIAVAVGWNVAAAMLRGLTRLRRHRVARRARKIANAQQRDLLAYAAAAEAFAAFGLARRRRAVLVVHATRAAVRPCLRRWKRLNRWRVASLTLARVDTSVLLTTVWRAWAWFSSPQAKYLRMLEPIAAKAPRVQPKALDGTSLYKTVELPASSRRAIRNYQASLRESCPPTRRALLDFTTPNTVRE